MEHEDLPHVHRRSLGRVLHSDSYDAYPTTEIASSWGCGVTNTEIEALIADIGKAILGEGTEPIALVLSRSAGAIRAMLAERQAAEAAAIERCAKAVRNEALVDPTDSADDIAYNHAIDDAEGAIRSLLATQLSTETVDKPVDGARTGGKE